MNSQVLSTDLQAGKTLPDRHLILVSLDWTRPKDPRVPLGHASLLSTLQTNARVTVHPLSFPKNETDFSPKHVLERILATARGKAHSALDLGFGAYVWNEPYLKFLLPELRRRGFDGRIILGGPQISYAGKGLETLYPEADVFVRGYGEEALAELVTSSEKRPIRGVHYAGQPDNQETAQVDIEHLPSPWLSGVYSANPRQKFIRWETQRGCPFRCSFCEHREPDSHYKPLRMNQDRLLAEIDFFVKTGVEDIAVLDPIFNLGKRSVEILNAFRDAGFKGRLSLQCRFETITEAFLNACSGLNTRLEFGLQTIHESEWKAINRTNDIGKVQSAMREVRSRHISWEVSLIFGLPEQTLESFRQTVAFCLEQKVPVIKAFPLQLLRGTPLERDRAKWGLIENGKIIPSVVRSDTFDEADWLQMARIAETLEKTEGNHTSDILAWVEGEHFNRASHADKWSPAEIAV